MPRYTIFCSTNISRELSRRRSGIGASQSQQPSNMAWLSPHFRRHSPTSIVIALLGCPQTSCKHSAISSARTPTNESISPVYSTRNGSSLKKNQPKNRRNQKHPSRITQGNSCSRRPCGRRARFAQRSGYRSPKIVRLAPHKLFARLHR